MIRTQIYLPKDLKLQLQIISKNEGVPVSEIIRRSTYKEIAKKKKNNAGATLLKIASMATKGGSKDLSSNFFDYAYGKRSSFAK